MSGHLYDLAMDILCEGQLARIYLFYEGQIANGFDLTKEREYADALRVTLVAVMK